MIIIIGAVIVLSAASWIWYKIEQQLEVNDYTPVEELRKRLKDAHGLLLVAAAILIGIIAYSCYSSAPNEEGDYIGDYWRTKSSGVIHNSTCRWYGKSLGEFVEYDAQGRNCSQCGGNGI